MRRGIMQLVDTTMRVAAERLVYSDMVMPRGVPVPREHRLTLDELEEMRRDPNIWACMLLRATATFPGYHLRPYDSSPEAAYTCDLVKDIVEAMPNSLLRVAQEDILVDSYSYGWVVGELVQQDIVLDGVPYIGLRALKTKPAKTFDGWITLDDFGNVERIQQLSTRGFIDADLSRTFYITNEASASFPYGAPVLDHVYDAWTEKQHVFRAWAHYCDVFGGGRWIAQLDENDMERWAQKVYDVFKGMQTGTVSVIPKNAAYQAHEAAGTGSNVYAQNMSECEKQIRMGILGQETVNAEGDRTGTYGSRKAQMSLLMQMFAGKGDIFAEQLSEQVLGPLCAWNHLSPVPRFVPSPEAEPDEDAAGVLNAIGSLYSSGIVSYPIPGTTQKELVNLILGKVGLKAVDAPLTTTQAGNELLPTTGAPAVQMQRGLLAAPKAAPDKARQKSAVLALKPIIVAAETAAVKDIEETWAGMVPEVVNAILAPMVDVRSKNWKFVEAIDPALVRTSTLEGVKTGGRQMQDRIMRHVDGIFREGWKSARDMMPASIRGAIVDDPDRWKGLPKGKAALSYTGRGVSPMNAKAFLYNDIYVSLGDHYTTIGNRAYHVLKDALYGYRSPEEAARDLAGMLQEQGLSSYARSMVQTMMAYAYNEGRQSLYRQFEVSGGTGPTDIIGYEFVAVMDAVTTPECQDWNGVFFRVDDGSRVSPPLHYGCRSVLVPVFGDDELWGGGEWSTQDYTRGLKRPMLGFGGA